jgi:hypothetical protein
MEQAKEGVVITVSPSEARCLRNLKPGEPSFTIRAQDVTGDVVVGFWVRAQMFVNKKMAEGSTLQEAIYALKDHLDVSFSLGDTTDPKLLEALETVMAMGEWSPRKLAD